jgi:hypothetical protein
MKIFLSVIALSLSIIMPLVCCTIFARNIFLIIAIYGCGLLLLSAINFYAHFLELTLATRKNLPIVHHLAAHYWQSNWSKVYILELGMLLMALITAIAIYS